MSSLPISTLLNQRITVKTPTITDEFTGEQTFSIITNIPARVQINRKLVFGRDGTQIPTYATVYTLQTINKHDIVVLPDGSEREVLDVSTEVDGDGNYSHSEVYI